MRLTRSGKQTFLTLIIGNIIIFIAAVILYHYSFVPHTPTRINTQTIEHISKVAERLETLPTAKQKFFIMHNQGRGFRLNISSQPRFKVVTKLTINKTLAELNKKTVLQRSLPIGIHGWLNVSLEKSVNHWIGRLIAVIILTLTWLIALIVLAYWAVRRLNLPLQTMQHSLQQVQKQQDFIPMALIGDKEQQAVMQQINDLQYRLHKLLNDRTQMLAAISHDLRTPLTRLKLRAEYLQTHEQYEKLMRDITEMEAMISETLDYFRESTFEEAAQNFDLNALLNSICDDFADLNFAVSYHSNVNKLPFNGRIHLLKRAFNNLINNAIHYGKTATVTLTKTEHHIEITVDDQGEGVSEANKEKLFNPFYRAESSRSRETGGSGLGLTIVKEVVQLHQGKIDLLNLPEGGLRVKVILNIT